MNVRTIVITGVTRGLGRAMARFFAGQGHRVAGCGRDPEKLASLREELGAEAELAVADVTNEAEVGAFARAVLKRFGAPDLLLNNAALINRSAPLWEVTEDDFSRVIDVNLKGVHRVIRHFVPAMIDGGRGVIVNVTSSTTIGVMPLVAVYAASKCAVEGFTESMAYELEPFNIKARLVEPGYAPTTNFTANGSARMEGLIPADYMAFAQGCFAKMANYPTAYCTEAEVAEAVLAAATDEGTRIRYPAGADTKLLAELRWSTSAERYEQRMRELFRPAQA